MGLKKRKYVGVMLLTSSMIVFVTIGKFSKKDKDSEQIMRKLTDSYT